MKQAGEISVINDSLWQKHCGTTGVYDKNFRNTTTFNSNYFTHAHTQNQAFDDTEILVQKLEKTHGERGKGKENDQPVVKEGESRDSISK